MNNMGSSRSLAGRSSPAAPPQTHTHSSQPIPEPRCVGQCAVVWGGWGGWMLLAMGVLWGVSSPPEAPRLPSNEGPSPFARSRAGPGRLLGAAGVEVGGDGGAPPTHDGSPGPRTSVGRVSPRGRPRETSVWSAAPGRLRSRPAPSLARGVKENCGGSGGPELPG